MNREIPGVGRACHENYRPDTLRTPDHNVTELQQRLEQHAIAFSSARSRSQRMIDKLVQHSGQVEEQRRHPTGVSTNPAARMGV
jgi:hypothetical protein